MHACEKYRVYGLFQMGDQVVQKVGLSDESEKEERDQ